VCGWTCGAGEAAYCCKTCLTLCVLLLRSGAARIESATHASLRGVSPYG
jgi:hypothetical protein